MCYYKYTTAQPTPNTLDWQQEYQSLSGFPALRGQKTFANLPSSRKASQQRDAQARGGTGATIMNSETANGGADDMVLDRVDPAPLKLEQFLPYRINVVDVFASTRQYLTRMTPRLPGSRVLAARYGANVNRLVVPKGQTGQLAFINEFVEQAKASGLIQQALDRNGADVFQVAPPGDIE